MNNTHHNDEHQVYLTLINQWSTQYQTLLEVLGNEQKALENRDFDGLGSLIKKKDRLVEQINNDQIPSIINRGTSTPIKLKQVRNYCLKTPQLKSHWDKLMAIVDQCNHNNEVNAQLIVLISKSTKRAFNLIKGFDPDNNIYDSKGDRKQVKHFGQPLSA